MAFPVSSDILINVLRESCASIEQGYSKKQERIYQQQSSQSGVINNAIGTDKSLESLKGVEKICFPCKIYKKGELEGLINVKRDFPLVSNLSNQESPPIDWNLHQESKFSEPLKEENESDESSISSVGNREEKTHFKDGDNMISSKSGNGSFSETQSQKGVPESVITQVSDVEQSTPIESLKKLPIRKGNFQAQSQPSNNNVGLSKGKKNGILGRIMSRGAATNEHITTSGAIIDDSTSSDSFISKSSMISGSESALDDIQGTEDRSNHDEDVLNMNDEAIKSATDSDESVGSIESSEIADDDDQDYLLEPSYLASSYAEGGNDEVSSSSSDDYYLDSDYDDSDLIYDSSVETSSLHPHSSVYQGDHPVSRINFTRSRPGTYTPFKISRRGASIRSRNNALSASQRSRFSSNVRPANLSVIPARLSLAPASLQSHRIAGTRNSKSLTNMLSLYADGEDKKPSHQDLDFTKRPVKRCYRLKSRSTDKKDDFRPVDNFNMQESDTEDVHMPTKKVSLGLESEDELSFSPKVTANRSVSSACSLPSPKNGDEQSSFKGQDIKSDESLLAGDELSDVESLSTQNTGSESISLPSSPEKMDVKSKETTVDTMEEPKSNLTALIRRKTLSLDYYEYVGGKKLPDDKISTVSVIIKELGFIKDLPLKVKIDTSATVVEMIGYVLLQVWKMHKPEIQKCHQQPNYWAMYLADDDGEAEDDFGVLSRTRKVKSYGTDEFFMTQVGEKEMKRNEVLTPSPLEMAEKKSKKQLSSLGSSNIVMEHARNTSVITIPSNLTPASHAMPHLLSPHTVQHDESSLITNESSVLDARSDQKKTDAAWKHEQQNTSQHQSLFKSNIFASNKKGDVRLSMYHRWTVWKRQQMSFKARHPKSLVVDGYQIYILPFNESNGSWYEAKTVSFNIEQIMRIKQSSKIPRYFKIFVNKSQNGVYKKYYLEAKSTTECREITSTIKNLIDTYRREFYH